ncbi:hypothetical protein AC579_4186 [Pseudocercospora musae]|uniref:Uncharacterized protein n=1 Tax=Pseudocercospora musae TaxID=113226 RepID=A0A139IBA6_9PEZI|nr:hypothetical protein AC579_4186 [Pseudocercospora musae]
MADQGAWLASQMPKECLHDFEQRPWIPKILADPFPFRNKTRNSSIHSLFNRTLATLETLEDYQAFVDKGM